MRETGHQRPKDIGPGVGQQAHREVGGDCVRRVGDVHIAAREVQQVTWSEGDVEESLAWLDRPMDGLTR